MAWDGATPPYRIETDRLVIRCWEPRDAVMVKDAVDSSIDHLRAFMPWVRLEPQTEAEKVELLRGFRGRFDLGEDFIYGIFDRGEAEAVGGSGLHPRVGPGGLEIGYWVRASRTRQGIATEVTAALTRIAFDVCGARRVELRIEPGNEASLGVARKLGFVEEARLPGRLASGPGEEPRDGVFFARYREASAVSPVAPLQAWDAAGSRIV